MQKSPDFKTQPTVMKHSKLIMRFSEKAQSQKKIIMEGRGTTEKRWLKATGYAPSG